MWRRLSVLVAILVLAAAAWSGAWFWFAGRLQSQIELWATARRAEGLEVAWRSVAVSGFPFTWQVDAAAPHLAGAGPTAWRWDGERLIGTYLPWMPRELAVSLPGRHTAIAGTGDLAERWTVRAARPDGRITVDEAGRLTRLTIDLHGVEAWRGAEQEPYRIATIFGVLSPHRVPGADHRTDTLDMALRITDAVLPRAPVAVLGAQIASADVDLAFMGKLSGATLAAALAAWRDDGGTIEFRRLGVHWGPADVDGSGTLTLDEANRPLGAFTARLRGYNQTIDALVAAGQIRPMEAAGARIALNLLARQQPGQAGEVTVPVTLQDGRLFVAGFALMRLPAIRVD